jgi:microcin C transport system substrate-binding protein
MKSLVLALLILATASPALASEAKHAFALHGDPKYPATYTHFEYTNPDAPKGGTLNLSAIGTFDTLNPYIVKGVPAGGMAILGQTFIYDSLMEQSYDEPFSMYGLIAETVEQADDNSWVAFNLNKAAKWADGQPITSADVIWTFNALMQDGSPFYKAYYHDVKDVTAEGDHRVKFAFSITENRELPLIIAQLPVLPKHYWEQPDKKFTETTLVPPLGSGPYKIGRVVPGRSIQYVRDENYWAKDLPVNKGRFNFDRITYTYFRDSNVALEAFFGGKFDIIQEQVAKLWATAYDAPAVKDGRVIKKEIPNTRPTGMQGFIYNTRRPVFQDPEVRKALAYAFDFDWSNKQFAYGAYSRTNSYFENSTLASEGLPAGRELEILEKYKGKIPEEVFTTEYKPPATDGSGNNRENMKQAANILEAAGYKLGKDGVRVNDKGIRLEFEMIDNNPAFERWTMPFIQNLKKIGVAARYRVVDDAQYTNRLEKFDFDMTTMVIAQSDSPGNEQRDFWGSSKADLNGSRNYIGIKDPVVDELIDLIINAPDRAELEARTKALDRVLLWNHYVIPHWYYGAWRIAWWKKLQHPEKLSGLTPAISDTWWAVPAPAPAKAK